MTVTMDGPALLPLEDGEQYRFVFDMTACIGCHSCEVACAEQNDLPVEVAWRRVGEIEGGSYPATKRFHLSMACNHCLEPSCLEGCPTGAYVKLASGIVSQHADDCIGCQYCTWNCPYSVPVFHAGRKIVTKCDMCRPRLEEGQTPACVDACPTHAIGVERVNVAAWRADHSSGDAPNLPPSSITLSTTRIVLPGDIPLDTHAANDHDIRPGDPHWPLVAVTLLTQLATGIVGALVVTGPDRAGSVAAFSAAALSLPVSLFHLGRPIAAWKALRGLRRSWLSREVLAFNVFAVACAVAAVAPSTPAAAAALVAGLAGVYCSGRLYVVPGRPAWNTPLTIVSFALAGLATGPLFVASAVDVSQTPLRAIAAMAAAAQLGVLAVNIRRLAGNPQRAWRGSANLLTGRFRSLLQLRVAAALVGITAAIAGPPALALMLVAAGELTGRYLFYVTVVPLDVPGSFASAARGAR